MESNLYPGIFLPRRKRSMPRNFSQVVKKSGFLGNFYIATDTPKKTHGLSQKIQGTYFKISALYFKIYGLYFSPCQTSDSQ